MCLFDLGTFTRLEPGFAYAPRTLIGEIIESGENLIGYEWRWFPGVCVFSETKKAARDHFCHVLKCESIFTRLDKCFQITTSFPGSGNEVVQISTILNSLNGFIVDYNSRVSFSTKSLPLVDYPARRLHHTRVIDFCYRIMKISFKDKLPFASKPTKDG